MRHFLKTLFLVHFFFLPLLCHAGSPGPTRQELLQRRDSIMRSRLAAIQKEISRETGSGAGPLMGKKVYILLALITMVLFTIGVFLQNNYGT